MTHERHANKNVYIFKYGHMIRLWLPQFMHFFGTSPKQTPYDAKRRLRYQRWSECGISHRRVQCETQVVTKWKASACKESREKFMVEAEPRHSLHRATSATLTSCPPRPLHSRWCHQQTNLEMGTEPFLCAAGQFRGEQQTHKYRKLC